MHTDKTSRSFSNLCSSVPHLWLKFFTAILVLLMIAPAHAATRDLLAQGSADTYWIAHVQKDETGQTQTLVQSRSIGSDGSWKQIAQISARVVSLTRSNTNLIALLEGGDWMTVWDEGSSGGPLPRDGSKLLILAGDESGLWAIASAGDKSAPTTAAATTQSATTMPAGTLLLDQLINGRWKMLAQLPPSAAEAKQLSLAILDGKPVLAELMDQGEVRTFAWDADHATWETSATINADASTTRIKLLGDLPHTALWTAGASGGGIIHFVDQSPITLAIPADKTAEDVAVVGQKNIRVLSIGDGKIIEYAFGLDGVLRGTSTLPAATPPAEDKPFEWLSAVAAAVLTLVLLNAMRRRGSPLPDSLEAAGIHLAPFGRRLLAGTIDALPILATMFFLAFRMPANESSDIEAMAASLQIPLAIATAVYVLHTLICEWLFGWSIGKRVCGLHVTMIDGSPPTKRAIVLRNLLRIIDVAMFFPLVLVLISPLRQRVGDLAGETIVVTRPPSPGI